MRSFGVLLLIVLCGCAGVHPPLLDPVRTQSDFQSRSLSDQGLRRYIESHLAAPLPAWPPRAWTPELLTLTAYYYHPDLDIARARALAANAGVRSAAQRPNPTLGFPLQYNASATSPSSPWTLGLNLDVPVETAGKRGFRSAVAKSLSDAARIDLAQTGWNVRVRVSTSLIDHLITGAERDSLEAEVDARTRLVGLLDTRLRVGEAARPELHTARAALNVSQAALGDLTAHVARSGVSLAEALGVPSLAFEGVSLEWPGLDSFPDDSSLSLKVVQSEGLLNRLDVQRSLAEYRAAVSALQLETAKRYPDIHLGPGLSWDQGENKYALGFSFELPLFNHNQGPIAQAKARLDEARARFIATQAQAINETSLAWAVVRAARAALSSADSALSVQASLLRSAERALALGEADRVELLGERVNLAAAARTRLEALRTARTAIVALESAVQRPLGEGQERTLPDLSPAPRGESVETK